MVKEKVTTSESRKLSGDSSKYPYYTTDSYETLSVCHEPHLMTGHFKKLGPQEHFTEAHIYEKQQGYRYICARMGCPRVLAKNTNTK